MGNLKAERLLQPNEMGFSDGNWKYYLGSNSRSTAHCFVVFRILGSNKLSGLIKIVGAPHSFPFHLFANVLPTEIHISQMSVYVRLKVCEEHKHYLYIDNVSPTNTVLSMKLVSVRRQNLYQKKFSSLSPGKHRISVPHNERWEIVADRSEHVHNFGVNVSRSRSVSKRIIH